MLKRLRLFLKGYPMNAASFRPSLIPLVFIKNEPIISTTVLNATDKVYFGQYRHGNAKIFNLMQSLTDNQFRFGKLSREITRYEWLKPNVSASADNLFTYGSRGTLRVTPSVTLIKMIQTMLVTQL